MKTNAQFKNEALAALRGNWGKAVVVTLLYFLVLSAAVGPTSYQMAKAQAIQQEQLSYMNGNSIRQLASIMQDPDWLEAQTRMQQSSSVSFLLIQVLRDTIPVTC